MCRHLGGGRELQFDFQKFKTLSEAASSVIVMQHLLSTTAAILVACISLLLLSLVELLRMLLHVSTTAIPTSYW